MPVSPQQREIIIGLIARRAARMTFDSHYSEGVVESVIVDDMNILNNGANDVDDVMAQAGLEAEI